MAEEKDKPLDQQIKEAELAKLKAETADVEKRSKQARVMGVPLVQIRNKNYRRPLQAKRTG